MAKRILFVCTGNICRSPTAEAVAARMLRDAGLADRVIVDSAGTIGYHTGEPPDHRSTRAAARRGYSMESLRARRVAPADFAASDLLLAMAGEHADWLRRECPGHGGKVRMFLEFADGGAAADVPDPYYGGDRGFEEVLDLIERGARALVAWLQRDLRAGRG